MDSRERLTLTPAEAAQELGISRILCYQLIREKRLPAVRISDRRLAVPRKALLALLEGTPM